MVIANFRSRLNFIWALFSWWKFQNIFMQNRKIVLFKQLRKGGTTCGIQSNVAIDKNDNQKIL